jgi:hypothetical protein
VEIGEINPNTTKPSKSAACDKRLKMALKIKSNSSNKIDTQIRRLVTMPVGNLELPEKCPICVCLVVTLA